MPSANLTYHLCVREGQSGRESAAFGRACRPLRRCEPPRGCATPTAHSQASVDQFARISRGSALSVSSTFTSSGSGLNLKPQLRCLQPVLVPDAQHGAVADPEASSQRSRAPVPAPILGTFHRRRDHAVHERLAGGWRSPPPGRFLQASTPSVAKRARHLRTVRRLQPSTRAMASLGTPSLASKTIFCAQHAAARKRSAPRPRLHQTLSQVSEKLSSSGATAASSVSHTL